MKRVLYIAALLLFAIQAEAQTYMEAFAVDYGDSFRGKNLYLEHSFNGEDFFTVTLYDDPEFESKYFGLGRTFEGGWGTLQLSLGVGEAEYDGMTTFVYNPTIWWERGSLVAFGEYEYYKDDREGSYYRGYVYGHVTKNVIAGAYTESDVGNGPLLGVEFEVEGPVLQFFVAKPVFSTPGMDIGETDLVAYATAMIEFNL